MAYILIVDDDEDFATATGKVLKDAGHEVSILLDTASALRSVDERRPDLMVLDVMFPEDSGAGFGLARDLQARAETKGHIPILMLTAVNARFPLGFSSKDISEDWMPVSDFLEKPVDLDVLADHVATLLAKASRSAR